MGKYSKLRQKILVGGADSNIEFPALCQLLIRLGFDERVKGGHHILTLYGVDEIINLQPKGSGSCQGICRCALKAEHQDGVSHAVPVMREGPSDSPIRR
ncbi:hypothetical protein [Halomonas sp.]|uniref:hypothetical protein n=1 Tax=Halomonas sp. TaxID=1486246 RepID=UPI00356870B4